MKSISEILSDSCPIFHRRHEINASHLKNSVRNLADAMHAADPSAQFAMGLWDGDILAFGAHPKTILRFKTPRAAAELFARGFLGFGECYTSGELEVEGDLQELLRLGFAIKFDDGDLPFSQKLRLLPHYIRSRNTVEQAPCNIAGHYGLENEFYSLYLDETMTYSCAYFKTGEESLDEAQLDKYRHIARKLLLKPGERLLDVGCGWGGMLILAAREYGIRGIGNTISRNQFEYANERIKVLGLQNQIEVVLDDYRNLRGKFDKFVSIGMFEHVGKEYIPTFMHKVSSLLEPRGLGLLHTIGKDVYSHVDPWTERYIFPGGYVPNLPEIVLEMGLNGLPVLDVENLRMHYARTLDRWAANYEKNAAKIAEMFDESFVRMWRLYLNTCAAGFKYGYVRLFQVLFSNGLNNELPLTRNGAPYP